MDEKFVSDIKTYAKLFADKKFIDCGYIAVRYEDGILITATKADLNNIEEKDVVFVNDKNIDSFEGNFRAAAVILFCAIRQDSKAEAAVIADSDAILKFSSKRKALMPILDEVSQLCGITVKCATKNVAAEVVTSLSGWRNACFMPDAGAVIKARSLEEVLKATAVLDKACTAQLIADSNGLDTQRMSTASALIEQCVFKFKTAKKFAKSAKEEVKKDEKTVVSAQPEAVAVDTA
ncbi:MAG: class II aldolase/adducin family protein, partial [Clostridia bacterium]|nr:class II aldolase/adducin family protein [Clostridia bacterium]